MFHIQSILGSISLILLFIIFVIYVFRKHDYYVALILLISFLIRLVFSFLQEFYQVIPYVWDEEVFYNMSIAYFEFLFGEGKFPYDITKIGSVTSYGTFLGTFYFFFGQHPFIARLVGCILGSSVIFLIYKISINLKIDKKFIYLLCLIVSFTPSYIVFSGLIMRDMLVWLLTYIFIYLCYLIFKKVDIKYLLYTILVTVPLVLLRKQYAPLYILYFFVIFLLFLKDRKYYFLSININFIKYIFTMLLVILGFYGIYSLLIYELSTWNKTEIVEYFSTQMTYRSIGGAAYLQNLEYNSYIDIIKYIPIKFFYFVYGPFIWSAFNLFSFLTAIENLLIWFFSILFVFRLKYIKFINDKNEWNFFIFLLFYIFISLAANSVIDSNFGTAIRHKMIFIPLFYILVFYLSSIRKKIIND